MVTCNECVHYTPPHVPHACLRCTGSRIVMNGSNFKPKPILADPDPYENTKCHAVVEVTEADHET